MIVRRFYRICLGISVSNSIGVLGSSHGGIDFRNSETLLAILSALVYLTTLLASFFSMNEKSGLSGGFITLLVVPTTLLSIFISVIILKIDLEWISTYVLLSIAALLGLILSGIKFLGDFYFRKTS